MVRQGNRERMQRDRAMGIEHALGFAGRPGRVTHAGAGRLVDVDVAWIAAAALEQRLVVLVLVRCRQVAERKNDDSIEVHLVPDLLEGRQQDVVHDEKSIPGVVDDVRELVRMQPEVERVDHAADGRHAEIRFEVSKVVPHQRRDAIAGLEAGVLQDSRERTRSTVEVRVGVAMRGVVRPLRDDLHLGKDGPGAIQKRGQRELRRLHSCVRSSSLFDTHEK